jgi:hypothetical protein
VRINLGRILGAFLGRHRRHEPSGFVPGSRRAWGEGGEQMRGVKKILLYWCSCDVGVRMRSRPNR